MYYLKVTNVLLAVYDNARTAHVTTASDHDEVSGIEFCDAGDLILGEVEPDGVVHFDDGIGVTNSTSVVSDDVGDAPVSKSNLLHLEKLVCPLLSSDPVDNKATLDIIKQAEVLAGLLDRENI